MKLFAVSLDGMKWDGIDLERCDWTDYDDVAFVIAENAEQAVLLTEPYRNDFDCYAIEIPLNRPMELGRVPAVEYRT